MASSIGNADAANRKPSFVAHSTGPSPSLRYCPPPHFTVLSVIGNTPLVKLNHIASDLKCNVSFLVAFNCRRERMFRQLLDCFYQLLITDVALNAADAPHLSVVICLHSSMQNANISTLVAPSKIESGCAWWKMQKSLVESNREIL